MCVGPHRDVSAGAAGTFGAGRGTKSGISFPKKLAAGFLGGLAAQDVDMTQAYGSQLMVLAWNCEVRRREASGGVDDSVSTEEASLPRSVGKALVPTVRPPANRAEMEWQSGQPDAALGAPWAFWVPHRRRSFFRCTPSLRATSPSRLLP